MGYEPIDPLEDPMTHHQSLGRAPADVEVET